MVKEQGFFHTCWKKYLIALEDFVVGLLVFFTLYIAVFLVGLLPPIKGWEWVTEFVDGAKAILTVGTISILTIGTLIRLAILTLKEIKSAWGNDWPEVTPAVPSAYAVDLVPKDFGSLDTKNIHPIALAERQSTQGFDSSLFKQGNDEPIREEILERKDQK